MLKKKKNFVYKIFGVPFSIDFELNGFDQSTEKPVFSFKKVSQARPKAQNKTWSSLSLSEGIIEDDILFSKIDNASLIKYYLYSNISYEKKIIKLLHQPLAYILFQLGFCVLHGSAISLNDKSIILCGLSGSGKSQLIYELSKKYKLISDDIIAISFLDGSAYCQPGLPFICAQVENGKKIENDKRKRSFKHIDKSRREKNITKVDKIFFLDWGYRNNLKEISDEKIFKKLILNSFRPLPQGSSLKSEEMYLDNIANLVTTSKFYNFIRKKDDINSSLKLLESFIND